MNNQFANDRIAFSASRKDKVHAFLCITDVRKEEIERHVLNILSTQKELSFPDAMIQIKDTIPLSTQEWIWVSHTLSTIITERVIALSIQSQGFRVNFISISQ